MQSLGKEKQTIMGDLRRNALRGLQIHSRLQSSDLML